MSTAVGLSPLGNAFNFATTGFLGLNAGQIYTYLAGSTTPYATWTTIDGDVENDNPIVLGVDGRPPNEIWLDVTVRYKFVLKDADDNEIQSYDDLYAIPTPQSNTRIGAMTSADGLAYTMTFPGNPVLSYEDGLTIYGIPGRISAGATTINIDSVGIETLQLTEALAVQAADLQVNDLLQLVYSSSASAWVVTNRLPGFGPSVQRGTGRADSANGKDYTFVDQEYGTNIVRTNGTTLTVIFDDVNTDTAGPYTFEISGSAAGPESMLDQNGAALLPYQIAANSRYTVTYSTALSAWQVQGIAGIVDMLPFMMADQSTAISTGTKATITAPYTLVPLFFVGAVATASSSGAVTLNLKENGTTIFSTAPTIDANETSTLTAATPWVISDRSIAQGSTVTFTIDGAGTGAKGAQWYLFARRA